MTEKHQALLVGAVGAEDVSPFGDEALVGETEGASFTVEAVFVPDVALVVHHVHAFAKTCNGVLAAAAFLCHRVLVAVHTEDLVLVVGETGPCQWLRAAGAHKTMAVPWLVLVVHSARSYGLFAADAVFGKLLVVAWTAVNVISFGDETLRSYWSFTAATGETLVVPRVPFILHTLRTSQYGFIAAVAAWSILP